MLTPEPLSQRRQRRQAALGSDGLRFRDLIGKLGSGERTSTGLSREEAQEAYQRLLGGVDPAQASAFLLAHRLRRPRACEMAGMIDAYGTLGPTLPAGDRLVLSFGVPFDGRCRDAPILPLTALLLNSAGLGVVLQGGDPMPVKYGATHAELLEALELPLHRRAWPEMVALFQRWGLALLHQPRHFPQAQRLVAIRELIGKRPPIATLELLWSCYRGPGLQVSGFVHAPTEQLAWDSWALTGQSNGITVKGLEGGVDLPTSRVSIAGHSRGAEPIERLVLHAKDHDLRAPEEPLSSVQQWAGPARESLKGDGPLLKPLIWNGGFYLWRSGHSHSLEAGLELAASLIHSGQVENHRRQLADWLGQHGAPPMGS